MSEEKFRVIYDTSEETRIKELARMREKALHDEATYLKEAMEKGLAQGRAEVRAERDDEIIARMRELGYPEDSINEILTK